MAFFGLALLKNAQEIAQGQAGIQNVFHHDYGFAFDAGVDVLVELYLAGGARILAVDGNSDEIEGNLARNWARQVGEEQYGAFQHSEQQEWLSGKIDANGFGQFADSFLDFVARDNGHYS